MSLSYRNMQLSFLNYLQCHCKYQPDIVGERCVIEDGSQHGTDSVIDRVQSFVEKNRGQSVMCFTDGATSESEIGRGCSAAVLFPLGQDSGRIELCELSSNSVDSVEAEVTAIALSLESAVNHFNSSSYRKAEEHLIVFTDCKPTISIVTQRSQMNDYNEVSTHLRLSLQTLNDVCTHIRDLDSWSCGYLLQRTRCTVAREAFFSEL